MKDDYTYNLSLHPLTLAVTLLLLCLSSCTSVREAQQVVAEADSLRNAGQSLSPFTFHLSPSKSDSAAIAGASAALQPFRLFYPTAYAHANYYYGRILRTQGNQPEAMLAFLRVVHSRTKDHAIKGRTYSNIANMCRLAAEHELAYEIYEKAAEEFLLGNDSLNYFYVTNSRAYECAEMGDKEQAFLILRHVENECIDSNVLSRVLETKAEACYRVCQYDSTLFYISQTYAPFNEETSNLLIRAQAFSCLNNKDSAIHYATRVFQQSPTWFEMNNALYILANDDERKNKEEVLQVAADRSDVQKLIEIRQGQLSQATQLLQQDLNRKPDLTWLWAIFTTLVIIGVSISIYIRKKKAQRQLYSQQVEELQFKQASLSAQAKQHQEKALTEIEIFCDGINTENVKDILCWKDYDQMRNIVNNRMFGLADKLQASGIKNPRQVQLCILVAIGKFRDKQMGDILCYADNTVRSSKKEAAKILGTSGKNLRSHLLQMAVG